MKLQVPAKIIKQILIQNKGPQQSFFPNSKLFELGKKDTYSSIME